MSAEIIHHSLDKFWWAKFFHVEGTRTLGFQCHFMWQKTSIKTCGFMFLLGLFPVFFFFKFCHRLCCDWRGRQVLLQAWIHRSALWKVGAALLRAPFSQVGWALRAGCCRHPGCGWGSAGSWLRAGVGLLVSLRLGKGLLGKTQDCHFIDH